MHVAVHAVQHDHCAHYCGFGTMSLEALIPDPGQTHNYPIITRPVTQMPIIWGRVIVRVIVHHLSSDHVPFECNFSHNYLSNYLIPSQNDYGGNCGLQLPPSWEGDEL